jgi:small subunit ribosomal protein S6
LETITKRLYEGMFLVDSGEAARDWDGVLGTIDTVLKRSDAEVISVRKWDERELAYRVGKATRGTYILVYFRVDSQKVHEIERDIQLTERIMRALILSAEHMTQEDIDKDTPAMRAEREPVAQEQEEQEPESEEEEESDDSFDDSDDDSGDEAVEGEDEDFETGDDEDVEQEER